MPNRKVKCLIGVKLEETLEELDEHENENTTSEAEEDNLEATDSSSNESVTPPNLEKRVRRVPTYLQD